MTNLEELKAAYVAATPGEWREDDDGFIVSGNWDDYKTVVDARCDKEPFADANTAFIALAHNLMPTLLEAVGVLKQIDALHPKDSILIEVQAVRTVLEKLK